MRLSAQRMAPGGAEGERGAMTIRTAVTTAAAVLLALQAGLYFAFATGVMPGLARTDDGTFVSVMTRINVVIVNPLFLLTFVGAPLLAVVVAVLGGGHRGLLVAAAVLAVATVVITAAVNVPLNDALAAHGAGADALAEARRAFEHPWVVANIARTSTAAGALALLVIGALGRAGQAS